MTSGEKESARRFRRGDAGSFERLYSEYGRRIYRFCHRLCANTADAEDLTQEVFVAAYQGMDRFEGRSSLATWLYRIALFRWRKIHGDRRPETVPIEDAVSQRLSSPDPAQAGLDRMSLENALAELPDALREAFLLVKAEGMTCREAADVLAIPVGTLKFRVHQAAHQLQVLLEADGCLDSVRPAARVELHPSREVLDDV